MSNEKVQNFTKNIQNNKAAVILGILLVLVLMAGFVTVGYYVDQMPKYTTIHNVFVDVDGDGDSDLVVDANVVLNEDSSSNLP